MCVDSQSVRELQMCNGGVCCFGCRREEEEDSRLDRGR